MSSISAEGDRIRHIGPALHLLNLFARFNLPQQCLSPESTGRQLLSVATKAGKDTAVLDKHSSVWNIETWQLPGSCYLPNFDRVVFAESDETAITAELNEIVFLKRRRLYSFGLVARIPDLQFFFIDASDQKVTIRSE